MKVNNQELLIRIDERQEQLFGMVKNLSDALDRKVNHDETYKTMQSRIDTLWDKRNELTDIKNKVEIIEERTNWLWDFKNKGMGYLAAISIIVSSAAFLIERWILKVFNVDR